MTYLKYFLFIPLFILFHYFLDGWGLVTAWCCCGIFLAIVRIGSGHLIFPVILLSELLTGVAYWGLLWNERGQVSLFSKNSHLSSVEWIGLVIGTNLVTSFLCIVSAFYICRLFNKNALYNFTS